MEMTGLVETVESQSQASHEFPQPLGNLANSRRDSHIPTAPASGGKVENRKQVSHFPAYGYVCVFRNNNCRCAVGLPPVRPRLSEGDQKIKRVGRNSCR
jgi:hypothetical protein